MIGAVAIDRNAEEISRQVALIMAMGQGELEAAWAIALLDDTVPSVLWAVLIHPLGQTLESAVLFDTRQWVFAHARRSVGLKRLQQQTDAHRHQAQQRADQLQLRLTAQQRQSAEALRVA